MSKEILEQLGNKKISKAQLLQLAEADFGLVPVLFEGTLSPKATIRYGCGSMLADLSKKHPNELYPFLDKFIELLDSKHRILTWNAMAAITNLTAVDRNCKFDKIFDKYFGFLSDEYMVTVANVVGNSALIAKNKPYLADKIIVELLKVQNLQTTPHLTEECKLVIAEHAIKTFSTLVTYSKNREALMEFARKHQDSPRASLRRQAQDFLEKWQ